MTPFTRMQVPQEPSPSGEPMADEPAPEPETEPSTIEMPAMPTRTPAPDLVPMPEPTAMPSEPPQPSEPPSSAPQPQAVPAGGNSPLSRMMRATGSPDPAQRDLLAGLPPPPISEPLTTDTESSAVRRRRRNRRLLGLAAFIIVVAIGAWLWSGSEQGTEVPIITADSTPEKIKPAEEGGLQVQNQDVQVLDPTQSQGETVMPEPEQPMTPPAPSAEQAPTVVENAGPDSGTAPTPEAPAVDAPPAPEAPLAATPLPELDENAAADTTAATPPSPQAPVSPAPAAPAPEPAQSAETPAASAATEQTQTQPAPAPATTQPEPTQAAQPEPNTTQEAAVAPTAPAGNTRVQLAAGKSEESVKKEWAALQKAHPDLLGALTLNVERVDKGAAGIFYRLQAGPLADKAAATKLCASLKQQKQDCIVVTK
jgi:hypothetical protein